MGENLLLEELDIYQLSMEIGEAIWKMVDEWAYFPKKTIGRQFVEAADSIASNIAEAYGRYFYKVRKQFYYYSRGSLLETKTWAIKASNRGLISTSEMQTITEKLDAVHFKLNSYIKKLRNNMA